MAYIEPNSKIWILTGVPLDKSYAHTYYPWANGDTATPSTQFNSFINNFLRGNVVYKGKTYSYSLDKYSFLRHNRNSIKVKMPIDLLYDCNYMIFENTGYGLNIGQNTIAKKFYCFIDDVAYINDNTTEIKYTIDVMQTWHFDYTLYPCFVEREHAQNDDRGLNIIAEPVDTGEAVYNQDVKLLDLLNEPWYLVISCSFDTSSSIGSIAAANGRFSDGTWNQVDYWEYKVYNPQNPQDTDVWDPQDMNLDIKNNLMLATILNRTNGILNMFMCPESLLPNRATFKTFQSSLDESQVGEDINITLRPGYGNWTPHNAKLLTYPYCYFTIDNQQGHKQIFRYEYFKDCESGLIQSGDILFREFKNTAVKPEVRLVPINYLNDGANNTANFDYSIDITDFSIGSWATNDFIAKIVQAGTGLAIAAATKGASTLFPSINTAKDIKENYFNEKYNMAANSAWVDYANDPATKFDENMTPAPKLKPIKDVDYSTFAKDFVKVSSALTLIALRSNLITSIGNGNLNLSSKCFDFIARGWHIDLRFARIIDNFFDLYGYQTNEIKVPNRNSRPYFNYVKTANCKLNNEMMPADAVKEIEEIYNNGVTFWKDITTVGNYQYAIEGLNLAGVG